jgi:hypothetical protein
MFARIGVMPHKPIFCLVLREGERWQVEAEWPVFRQLRLMPADEALPEVGHAVELRPPAKQRSFSLQNSVGHDGRS